jgi:hypothetical protein
MEEEKLRNTTVEVKVYEKKNICALNTKQLNMP